MSYRSFTLEPKDHREYGRALAEAKQVVDNPYVSWRTDRCSSQCFNHHSI